MDFFSRIGPLGFLSSGQEDCPGNFGLKDQVEALKWIKKNIATFGGDPKRYAERETNCLSAAFTHFNFWNFFSVTVFGNSAGGASVTYLMQSSLAKDLFTKAIALSGVNLNSWAQPPHDGITSKRTAKVVKKFGCGKSNDWKQIIDCLRKVPAEQITTINHDFFVSEVCARNENSIMWFCIWSTSGMGYGSTRSISTSRWARLTRRIHHKAS